MLTRGRHWATDVREWVDAAGSAAVLLLALFALGALLLIPLRRGLELVLPVSGGDLLGGFVPPAMLVLGLPLRVSGIEVWLVPWGAWAVWAVISWMIQAHTTAFGASIRVAIFFGAGCAIATWSAGGGTIAASPQIASVVAAFWVLVTGPGIATAYRALHRGAPSWLTSGIHAVVAWLAAAAVVAGAGAVAGIVYVVVRGPVPDAVFGIIVGLAYLPNIALGIITLGMGVPLHVGVHALQGVSLGDNGIYKIALFGWTATHPASPLYAALVAPLAGGWAAGRTLAAGHRTADRRKPLWLVLPVAAGVALVMTVGASLTSLYSTLIGVGPDLAVTGLLAFLWTLVCSWVIAIWL